MATPLPDVPGGADQPAQAVERRSQGRRLWRRLRTSTPAMIGLCFTVVFVAAALFAPLLTLYTPGQTGLGPLQPPGSPGHLLGTDDLGRDLGTRVLYGARVSMQAAVMATLLSLVVAIPLGLVSGYYRGLADTIIMRVVDTLLAFPFLIIAIMMAAILGPSLLNVTIALGISSVPGQVRIIRGEVLGLREEDYIRGAVASGATDPVILSRHILPNLANTLLVQATVMLPGNILGEATLSFLGFGVPPPTPSWGALLNAAVPLLNQAAYMAVFPGVAIAIATLAFNLLGDGLRDSLDPKASR